MRLGGFVTAGTAVLAAAAVLAGPAAPAQARPHRPSTTTLANTVVLSNCSASLVRFPSSQSQDRAMVLTNGHCHEGGFLTAGEVLQDVPSSRTGTLLDADGYPAGTVTADRTLYATMTGTDVALYRLTATFRELRRTYGATPLTIARARPRHGAAIDIPSGYWKRLWNCKVDGFVGKLREDVWTWHDAIRYDAACDTVHGTSGSPIVDAASGQIVGINNTGNDDGQMCTLNNPCEVAPDGTTVAYEGQSYGEQTFWFTTCLSRHRTINLKIRGCLLTKPTH
jgi:Trypsin-like peptidase domain